MKRTVFLLLAVFLLSPHPNAQGESQAQVLFNGGYSLPQTPDVFKDAWNNGFNLGGGAGYRFGRFTVQGLVNYDRFSVNDDGVMEGVLTVDRYHELPDPSKSRIDGNRLRKDLRLAPVQQV